MQIWLCAVGFRRTPPAKAVAAMEAAIDLELARWKAMFGKPSA